MMKIMGLRWTDINDADCNLNHSNLVRRSPRQSYKAKSSDSGIVVYCKISHVPHGVLFGEGKANKLLNTALGMKP